MKKINLKYIAEELNIAPSTVSKALNGYFDVSANTKKRVVDLAKSLNFSPNTQAAFLRTRKSKIIGVIIPHIRHTFFINVLKGILDSAEKENYLIIILKSNESYNREKELIEKLLKQNVDGIFISLAQDTYDLKHLEDVKKAGAVLIQFDKISKMLESSKVVVNDRESGYLATEHLIKNGCRNIVHFRGPLLPQVSIDRFLGYKNALEDYDLIYDPKKVIISNKMTDKEGFKLMNDFLSKKIDFDGVFSMSDYTAIGAIESLKKHNLLVPDDIKVIGFSNWLLTDKLTPSLSTVNQPGVLMGNKCFELFLKEVNSKKKKIEFKYEKKIFKTKLVIRESSSLK